MIVAKSTFFSDSGYPVLVTGALEVGDHSNLDIVHTALLFTSKSVLHLVAYKLFSVQLPVFRVGQDASGHKFDILAIPTWGSKDVVPIVSQPITLQKIVSVLELKDILLILRIVLLEQYE